MTHQSNKRKDYTPADDYYTPKWLFDALGLEFDLDVCAPEQGVPWLPTKTHYHLATDGLAQSWTGRVWMNPPYSAPRPWIEKFVNHNNGLALLPFSRSKAFVHIWNHADAIMALPANFKFEHKDDGSKNVFMPVGLFALGPENVHALHKCKINRVLHA